MNARKVTLAILAFLFTLIFSNILSYRAGVKNTQVLVEQVAQEDLRQAEEETVILVEVLEEKKEVIRKKRTILEKDLTRQEESDTYKTCLLSSNPLLQSC